MAFTSLRSLFCENGPEKILDGEWKNVSLHSIPHIAECVQHVDLSWLPALFLVIFCPLTLYDLYRSEHARASCHSPVTYRILICVLLVIDLSCSFFHNAYSYLLLNRKNTLHYLVGDCAQYIGLCLALTLLIACRNRGIVTSGVLFNYWLLMVLCGLPELRFLLERHFSAGVESDLHFCLYMVYYPLACLELVLSCFADTPSGAFIGKQTCPELSTSFLNQITFNWFTGLAVKGYKKPLERDDLWGLNERDSASNLIPQFNHYFKPELQKCQDEGRKKQDSVTKRHQPSVLVALFKTYKFSFISGALLKLIFDLLQFVAPALLKQLIGFIQDRSQPMWVGIAIASSIFIVAVFQSMILHQYFHLMFRLGMNIRSVLTSAVYSKAMNLSNNARKNRTTGEIVNLMSVDIQRLQDMTTFVMLFWSAPLQAMVLVQVLLSIVFLWRILGVAVIAGLVILVAMVPFNSYISVKMRECQVTQMRHKDERMKLMSEILNGIKVLKLYAWEKSMQSTVLDIREREIDVLKRLAFLNAATTLSWACAPFLVAVLSFAVFVTIDPDNNVLTPQVTFVALALFNILRFPLAIFAMIFSQAVQCRVSNKRLKAFFAEEEMDASAVGNRSSDEALKIEDGKFTWENSEGDETLKNINLSVKRGQLVAIVGKVGSGKSSLLQAILGEMNKVSGTVNVCGSIAYVPQQAWIQNLTLRDNVLFNRSYDPLFYDKVVEACALKQDLVSLPAEDLTEIGEKGINLSGGQKQRVSLARAAYSHADIVLLDDPLSAVDSHVGKHIFENVISSTTGLLCNTTRILVTHGLHYLKFCDKVVVMKGGEINEMGTYQELIAKQGAFSEFIEEFLVEETKKRGRSVSFGESAEDVSEILQEMEKVSPERRKRIESQMSHEIIIDKNPINEAPSPTKNGSAIVAVHQDEERVVVDRKAEEKVALLGGEKKQPQKSKLVEKEGVETGKVKWPVYLTYIRAIGLNVAVLFISVYVLSSVLGVASNLWLAKWSDDAEAIQKTSNGSSYETNTRLAIYASLGVGQALFVCAASVIMALGMVGASRLLHEGILKNILHSPMLFFDTTPIGRILNRFGKDVDTVDSRLPEAVGELTLTGADIAVTIFLLVFVTPWVFGPVTVVFCLNAVVLDVEAIDTTLPGSIRSMAMTVFNVIATIVVIVIATPLIALPFALLAALYFMVLDVEMLDCRLPSAVLTFVGAVIQAVMILSMPIYATPTIVFLLAPTIVFYYFILDVDCLDNAIPRSLMSFVRTLIASVEIVMIILWATPPSTAVLVPLFAIYFMFLRFYVSTSRQLKRLESASRSPIYSHFQESIQGASSIRAYKLVDDFVRESERRLDENLATYYPSIVANRWLAVRLELVGNLIVMFSALFAVLFRDSPGLTAGLVGLSVSYALNITQTLNWAVRMTSELETNIVAVERIKEYTETPTEGAHSKQKPPDTWPQSGKVELKDVCLRYRPGLDFVLKHVSASISPKEKIGIVGRTGAGKSSLTLALFRTVEIDSGAIEIDGQDISTLSLEDLRSRLTIVPQDPVLFSGTLRFNLDPFDAYTDEEIWNALRNAHLEPFVTSLADKLLYHISEGGENLSVGQRQLLCLARALLRRPRILVLDEAAAAVDAETDSLLQRTIREQFADCTVLTIAHRLNTVMDCDRLLVLEGGQIVEFDSPRILLAKQDGLFRSMARDAGLA